MGRKLSGKYSMELLEHGKELRVFVLPVALMTKLSGEDTNQPTISFLFFYGALNTKASSHFV